jgi:hypothetical protein
MAFRGGRGPGWLDGGGGRVFRGDRGPAGQTEEEEGSFGGVGARLDRKRRRRGLPGG